jgi:hypothetical protein
VADLLYFLKVTYFVCLQKSLFFALSLFSYITYSMRKFNNVRKKEVTFEVKVNVPPLDQLPNILSFFLLLRICAQQKSTLIYAI